MIKMVVSDFDGTLIDDDESIPISTVLEIDKVRTNNIKFCVATGRILQSVLDYNKDFSFIDYIISCNGAYVYDCNLEKVIFKKNILSSIVKKIKKLYGENGIYFCTPNDWYLLKGKYIDSDSDSVIIDDFDNFYEDNKKDIYKVEVYFKNKKECDKAISYLEENNYNINVNKQVYLNKQYLIEITMNGINKFVGIEKLCKYSKIKVEDVVAIGDNYNDIEMVKNVGVGICVSNAVSELKKVSDKKTSSNNNKGVEKILKELC